MKKKTNKIENAEINVDDLDDIDMEDMDFGDMEDIGDDRKPNATSIAAELAEEGAKGFLDGLITNTAKKSLPDEYSSNYHEVMDYADLAKTTFEENATKVNNSLYKFSKEIKKILPFQVGFLNKYLEKQEQDFETFKQESEEQQQNNLIQSNLTGIFDKQLEIQKAIEAKRDAENEVEKRERITTTKMNYNVMANIDSNIANQTAFTMQISKEYYRKSLELQFKSFYIQSDMLKTIKDYYKGFSIQFDSIAKNTGLPEFVKLNNTERLQDIIRTQVAENTYKKLFSNNKYVEGVKSKMAAVVSNKISSVTEKIDAATDQLNMINSATEGQSGGALGLLANVGSGMLGGLGGEKLADKIAPGLKDKLKDNETINAGANYLNMLANSPSTFFSMLRSKSDANKEAYSDESNPIRYLMSKAFGFSSDLLSVTAPEKAEFSVKSASLLNHNKPAIFDNKVHRSITEIIPMYLAKILKENTDLRTMYRTVNLGRLKNFKGAEELVYNYDERIMGTAGDYQKYVEKKYLTSQNSKNRISGVTNTMLSNSINELSKDKKANKKDINDLRDKNAEKLLKNYFENASKVEGVNFSFDTLVKDVAEGKAPAELEQLLDDKTRNLLKILAKSNDETKTKDLNNRMGDVKRIYPIVAVKELFRSTSKLANSKDGFNLLKDDHAEIISKGLTRFIFGGKDVTIESVISLDAFRSMHDAEVDQVKDPLSVFVSEVRTVQAVGNSVSVSSLGVLLAAVNRSLRDAAELDPAIFQTLYELSPLLVKKGRLTEENLIERKLNRTDENTLSTVENLREKLKITKQEASEIKSKAIGEELAELVDGKLKNVVSEWQEAKTQPFGLTRLVFRKLRETSDAIKEQAKSGYEKYSKNLDDLKTTLNGLKEETIEKAVDGLLSKMQESEQLVDELIKSQTSMMQKEQANFEEAKQKLLEIVREDPSALNEAEKGNKRSMYIFQTNIKALQSLKQALSTQRQNITQMKQNGVQDKLAFIKNIRNEVFKTLDSVKGIISTTKEAEAVAA